MTPQFVYYVIPLAALLSVLVTFGLLSRSSELSVMKACGISLYRISLPLIILSLVWSGFLFGLEQRILARANEQVERLDAKIRNRPARTSSPLSRTWLIGRDGDIYLTGRVLYQHLDEEELDRLIGVCYETVETWFQTAITLGFR